ncbi:hypothetical protein ASG43_08935 [Aureimonas sp. Leaf454]|uniref:hypothetical protein n=1 Tax=Aureimonas sp. Leaf454 TaxID=1736381 RepID=UPI0006F9256F|nr:hypothetical protein [Aureimonas sp. Leaf454]KQT48948.1 hypothetical protein ASG43_08935 [Aureimonas sp. Leaf454]
MAPLPKIDKDATAITSMQSQGRYDEAMARLLDLLRGGTASPAVQAIAAEMLEPKAKGVRRGPKAKLPFKWLEMGEAYRIMRLEGKTDTEARGAMEDRYPRGGRTIDTIIAFYNSALHDYQDLQAASLRDESRK